MRCRRLENQYFLKVVHSKKVETQQKGVSDYYPFGMAMPSRTLAGGYRYAYQGQEVDPETGKEAFELRLWDSRLGRWLTPDPVGQHFSPYLGMSNRPNMVIDPDGGCDDGKGNLVACPDDGPGIPHQLDEITVNVVIMKPVSSYDYSQNEIPGKFQQDWNYILNGFRGNMFTRYGDILSRDWNASSAEDREGAIEAVTSIIPGSFFIKGGKTLGKGASKLTNKLFKHGKNGKLPTPKLNPNQFKTVGGESVHIKTGAIYRKSYTTHTNKHGEWKVFTKGTTNFGKQAKTTGNRITTDLEGNIIKN